MPKFAETSMAFDRVPFFESMTVIRRVPCLSEASKCLVNWPSTRHTKADPDYSALCRRISRRAWYGNASLLCAVGTLCCLPLISDLGRLGAQDGPRTASVNVTLGLSILSKAARAYTVAELVFFSSDLEL